MTKYQLFQALATRGTELSECTASNGRVYRGILQTVEREDGSGHSFNVTLDTCNGKTTIHVRTSD